MKKDEKIESAFERYLDGTPSPRPNLQRAKEEVRRRARRRRRLKWQIPAVAAVLLVALLLGFTFLPSLLVRRYSIAKSEAKPISAQEALSFRSTLGNLADFPYMKNAWADFALYRVGEKDVLIEAKVSLLSGLSRLFATVRMDLTDGKYAAEELEEYPRPAFGSSTEFEKTTLNGEYMVRGTTREGKKTVFFDCTVSGDSELFFMFLSRYL